ncbi:hypothetical protein GPL17_04055 [Bradyrhizobium yuanmingense]|nr:hypothetical protein [Bradyrhizobium yuanmingense]
MTASQYSSLRAKRSNPESFRGKTLDCFVARAPRNDGGAKTKGPPKRA